MHDLGELIRRAGRTAGLEVQSEFRVPLSSGAAGEIDWVWLKNGTVVAAFEIEGSNAARNSLQADYAKFEALAGCIKVVALYSVTSQLKAKKLPPRELLPITRVEQKWPELGMPGVQVLLDTELMGPGGIKAIREKAAGFGRAG
ncbi:MAG: hypothetical protein V4731_06290 [Pseudomonadota bacterium]